MAFNEFLKPLKIEFSSVTRPSSGEGLLGLARESSSYGSPRRHGRRFRLARVGRIFGNQEPTDSKKEKKVV